MTATETIRFTGKERDAETGLDYSLARYLSSAQGRFTSADPMFGTPDDPQSWNMYAYARNNPLLYTDPDGETYRICDADGKNCRDVSDEQFGKYQRESTGLRFQKGQIFAKNEDGSQTFIGSYKQTDVDLTSPQFIALSRGMQQSQGPVNVLAGASLAFVGVAGGVAAGGAIANALAPTFPEAAAFIPRAVMTFANKQAARAAIAGMGLTGPQAQEALRTISRATATSTVQIIRSGQQVIVSVTRMGRDGYQQVEKFIDQSGGVRVVQKGINAAGELTHYDIKR
jgi:RHS repeat-associated protein